jgi:quinol monooxygenase YgiN
MPRQLGALTRALYDNHLVKLPIRAHDRGMVSGPAEVSADPPEVEIAVLTATFDARPGAEEALLAALSRYVVLTRHEPECRNVDLVASVTRTGRILVIEKWESADAVQRHLDSALMTEMATAAITAVAAKPEIDLFDAISAYDLE